MTDRSTWLDNEDGIWVVRKDGSGRYVAEAEVKRLIREEKVKYNRLMQRYEYTGDSK